MITRIPAVLAATAGAMLIAIAGTGCESADTGGGTGVATGTRAPVRVPR